MKLTQVNISDLQIMNSSLTFICMKLYNTGWPRINGTVDTVDFQDFALINNYYLHFVG